MNAALLGLTIAHGALSQIVVGILLFCKGATFGLVVFFSYGVFWLSVSILVAMPEIAPSAFPAPSGPFMGAYFLLWGIFSFFCWICTFRQNRVIFFIFLTLWPTFVLLSAAHWSGDAGTLKAGGWLGILCGSLAFYLGLAELLNETVGSVLLPIGDPRNRGRERAFLRNWANQLRGREPEEDFFGSAKRDDVERGSGSSGRRPPAAADVVTAHNGQADAAAAGAAAAGAAAAGAAAAAVRKSPSSNLG
jgi:succinate-acetate transporter protein